jgi:hypothetical protein
MSIRGVRRLGDAYSDYLAAEAKVGWSYPPLTASQYQQAVAANLFSYSQDPRVPNNPNPIYAPGTPQWNAAIAALSTGQEPPPPGSTLASGTWNGDCNNPVVADAQGNLAYVAACYPNTPLGISLASQQAGGGPVSLNPSSAAATTPAPAPAAPSSLLSSLSGLPWYYYAGGAAALLFLFSGTGGGRH